MIATMIAMKTPLTMSKAKKERDGVAMDDEVCCGARTQGNRWERGIHSLNIFFFYFFIA